LVVECPADQAQATADLMVHEMEQAMSLKVPLKTEPGIGVNWFEAK
jgi:DNA polymerase I-like protein with 3'-5' exonuclease and polymerase domains